MAAAKRLRDDYEQEPEQPEDKRMRQLPSFQTVIKEAMMKKQLQNLFMVMEPIIRQVIKEEIEQGLIRSSNSCYFERAPQMQIQARQAPIWKLVFKNPPRLPIFTGSKIEDASGNPLVVLLVDANNGSPSQLPPSLRVEILAVFGDFPPEQRDDWTSSEFQKGVVKEREGKRPLLTGDINLTLRDGCATVTELQFTDNSSWIRSRKFRIGARVVPGTGSYDAPRIREAMTDAFVVRDHRGELYRKHYPPSLNDEVWRLEKIGKEGAFHRKLAAENIHTVQDFLKLWALNSDQLRAIMGEGMTDKMWEVTTNHAKTCVLGEKIYVYRTQHCALFLNSICQIVKIVFGSTEYTMQQLNRSYKNVVQQLLVQAYQHWSSLEEIDGNIAPVQNEVALQAAPATQAWYPINQELDYQIGVDEVEVAYTGTYQWNQMYNTTG